VTQAADPALRVGDRARIVVTSRSSKLAQELLAHSGREFTERRPEAPDHPAHVHDESSVGSAQGAGS
jgi:hypothetical protein